MCREGRPRNCTCGRIGWRWRESRGIGESAREDEGSRAEGGSRRERHRIRHRWRQIRCFRRERDCEPTDAIARDRQKRNRKQCKTAARDSI